MKTRKYKSSAASVGLGLLIFTFTFLFGNSYVFSINTIASRLTVDNQSTAVQSLNAIRTLQAQYASKHQGQFAPNFDELVKSVQLRDEFKGEISILDGYIYMMTVRKASGASPAFYSITAAPLPGVNSFSNERRHFYFDSTLGTIKCTEENRRATASDPSI